MSDTTTQKIEFLPENVKKEYFDNTRDGKSHFKKINWPSEYSYISTTNDVDLTINDSNSSNVFFTEAIKSGFISKSGYAGVLTGGTSRFFKNLGNTSSTTTLSAIYEHIRGYVYRDFGVSGAQKWNEYLATTAGVCGLIISKTLSGANHAAVIKGSVLGTGVPIASITALRIIAMNRGFFKDRVKPGTWRMNIRSTDAIMVSRRGLNFNNDTISDSNVSGAYASITGMAGLTGSLSAGILGSMLTGFSILMRIKPIRGGPIHQTLFHRRVADPSLSSLDYTKSVPGSNCMLVTDKYSDLNPLNAVVVYSSLGIDWQTGSIVWNYPRGTTPSTSLTATVKLTTVGGGQLNWTTSAYSLGSPQWLSLSSSLTTSILHTINNQISQTATITAYMNSNTGFSSKTHTSNAQVIIYNSLTSLQKCHNLPYSIPVILNII